MYQKIVAFKWLTLLFFAVWMTSCNHSETPTPPVPEQRQTEPTAVSDLPIQKEIASVYETLAPYFLVGAAIEPVQLSSIRHAELLAYHFNSLTAENVMKPGLLQPEEGVFRWDNADRLVQFAREHGMAVHGHTLVWHQQAADWMFRDEEGNPLPATPESKALVLQRLETHIRTVVDRYKDDINVWDVVNEVIDPQQSDCMRRSRWYELTGKDFIVTAFTVAREVDPDAILLINDYSETETRKRQCIYNLVKEMQEIGVPIDGIGMQMHINLEYPTVAAIEQTIQMYGELVEVHITEMDMSIYTDDFTSYVDVSDEILLQQGHRYKEIFEVFKRHADVIESVTFWGMADDHTWLLTFPTTRLNLPLLFDRQLQAKYAYWGVVDPAQLPDATTPQQQNTGKQADIQKGTPVIDGEMDALWTSQPWLTLFDQDGKTIQFQLRWDKNFLYVFVNVEGVPAGLPAISIYTDRNNGKTTVYVADDHSYSFLGELCFSCDGVSSTMVSDENGSRLEAAFPLEEAKAQEQIGFDIRVTLASQLDKPISWSDEANNQDTNTARFGTLTLVDAP